MIEINSQARVTDALHHFAKVTVEPFFADILVTKRRQHQHTSATVFHCVRCQLDRLDD